MENDFLSFIADILEVNESEISMDTEYKSFPKWDSLMMLSLVMEIESEYSVTIPIEKVGSIKTVADLYSYVK